jgi:hypothetical protein
VSINVQEGDELIVEGTVLYSATSVPISVPSENLSVRAQVLVGSIIVEKVVQVQQGGLFSAPLVLPIRTPLQPQLPIELTVLNVPGAGTSLPNTDSSVTIDSNAPNVVFDQFRFPTSSLLRLESDQLITVPINIIIDDSGGMSESNITVHWDFYRNGLPRLGMGGIGELQYVGVEDDQYHFGNQLDMRPSDGQKLQVDDQIIIWFEGADLAGNLLEGDGTEASPRVPLLEIIEFVPVLSNWLISPITPVYGESVEIQAVFTNEGLRGGSIEVTLIEQRDGDWLIHDSKTLNLTSLDADAPLMFEWEAWKAGTVELYIYIDGDYGNPIPVDEFVVSGVEKPSGSASSTILLIAIVGVLVVIVVGLLGVIVLRKPSESMDGYLEDVWLDGGEESFGATQGIRLDYEEDTLWNTVSRHGIYDKDAFLTHARKYDRDQDGFLDAEELDRAAADFTTLMAQSTMVPETEYPIDFNDDTVSHVIESHDILDKAAFLHFANSYDEDQNGYLKHSELGRAAADFIKSGRNVSAQVQTTPDPRLLSVAEVHSALPDWSELKINAWMDKGWSAQQIIGQNAEPSPPLAPSGFGGEYTTPPPQIPLDVESENVQTVEDVAEVDDTPEMENDTGPSAASLKRLKKAELIELATLQGLDSSGTKADIIARLLS